MNEERCIELIHAEIDGELSLHDRAELNRHLLANPAAMRLRDELKQVCMVLDGLEQITPPPRPQGFDTAEAQCIRVCFRATAQKSSQGMVRAHLLALCGGIRGWPCTGCRGIQCCHAAPAASAILRPCRNHGRTRIGACAFPRRYTQSRA